jgi:hypothetical protein
LRKINVLGRTSENAMTIYEGLFDKPLTFAGMGFKGVQLKRKLTIVASSIAIRYVQLLCAYKTDFHTKTGDLVLNVIIFC